MDFFIRILNGQPFEHPMLADNIQQAYPHIDINNLPPEFARFVRVEFPAVGVYEIHDSTTYEWSGDVVTDVHHVRQMTDEEKLAKQNTAKARWAEREPASWIFIPETCSFEAPIPKPQEGGPYFWNESTLSWSTEWVDNRPM